LQIIEVKVLAAPSINAGPAGIPPPRAAKASKTADAAKTVTAAAKRAKKAAASIPDTGPPKGQEGCCFPTPAHQKHVLSSS